MRPRRLGLVGAIIAGFLALDCSRLVLAQEVTSASAAPARELASLLDQAKLDSVAAKDPGAADRFVAALYFPGSQLLVVAAKYAAPALLAEKLTQKNYRDVYVDLNSAFIPNSKLFIEDLMADGLKFKPDAAQTFDFYENGPVRVAFDGEWQKQKLSEVDYQKAFESADQEYAKILQALVTALKKSS